MSVLTVLLLRYAKAKASWDEDDFVPWFGLSFEHLPVGSFPMLNEQIACHILYLRSTIPSLKSGQTFDY